MTVSPGAEDRAQRAQVGLVAGGEDQRRLGAQPVGQLLLELQVQIDRAVEKARAGQAGAVFGDRVERALADPLIAGQPEVVVGAQHDPRAPLHLDDRQRGALQDPEVGHEVKLASGPQLLHALVLPRLGENVYRSPHVSGMLVALAADRPRCHHVRSMSRDEQIASEPADEIPATTGRRGRRRRPRPEPRSEPWTAAGGRGAGRPAAAAAATGFVAGAATVALVQTDRRSAGRPAPGQPSPRGQRRSDHRDAVVPDRYPHARQAGRVSEGYAVEVRREVRPRWVFRLSRRVGLDRLTQIRGGVHHRLLHAGDEPVMVRVAQLAPDRVLFGAQAGDRELAEWGIERMRRALGDRPGPAALLRALSLRSR